MRTFRFNHRLDSCDIAFPLIAIVALGISGTLPVYRNLNEVSKLTRVLVQAYD
ncbi:hypothetical protein HOT82_gp084 [Gordonia phage Ronaldo]|uniref:Uncharacterized protein n=2 Tax=Ronaldovirus ronaldo TaxID=2734270 RepID=A0A6B9L8X5_9CAUD|nr:hypothetical protein HOT82_gp084 [Gordonia phage Ronaldo]AXN53646.1 hypothetical protein SEA_RONALDO_84 [Gordonia phage Ronaldo]QHB38200.1 hypothetical protein SEA_VOLT_84 [Gordonia phage Volt]